MLSNSIHVLQQPPTNTPIPNDVNLSHYLKSQLRDISQ